MLKEQCFQLDLVTPGMQQFIEAHPGVLVRGEPGAISLALLPDGTVYALDDDGTVLSEDLVDELGLQEIRVPSVEKPRAGA